MFDESTTGLPTHDGPFATVPEGMGAFAILDRRGDLKIIWDKRNPREVAAAKKTFEELTTGETKHLAFNVKNSEGDQGDQIREFDPNIERMVFVPQVVGG